jgi:hypothetical protein
MRRAILSVVLGCICLPAFAQNAGKQSAVLNQAIDRVVNKEKENMKTFEAYTPLVETYVQTYSTDKDIGRVPNNDFYFLGRAAFKGHLQEADFLQNTQEGLTHKLLHQMEAFTITHHHMGWVPVGFAQMAVIDASAFDRQHYDFSFVRSEFLGEVRCLVFDAQPKEHSGHGRFSGRIWVEDSGYNIVRFNGTYIQPKDSASFIHFDSWRINIGPGRWLPAYIYGEETSIKVDGHQVGLRSQTRLWGYEASQRKADEFTAVFVDPKDAVDQPDRAGLSPVASERNWQRQAEDNVLDKMQHSGLLAPESDVDKLLATVVNNLIVTNDLTVEPEVRCRVMLTAPIEAFTVGHTIVLSRGLLDVLPDEASLGAVLAEQLSHIVLGHEIDTKFSFADRVLFADDQAISRLSMTRTADEQIAADKKTLEIISKSPYKDALNGTGLFMKQLDDIRSTLPNLVRGKIGNALIDSRYKLLDPVVTKSPKLDKLNVKQVAALPLGARVAVDPWSSQVSMSKARSVEILSAREKMPFQITPFYPYLYRVAAESAANSTTVTAQGGGAN